MTVFFIIVISAVLLVLFFGVTVAGARMIVKMRAEETTNRPQKTSARLNDGEQRQER